MKVHVFDCAIWVDAVLRRRQFRRVDAATDAASGLSLWDGILRAVKRPVEAAWEERRRLVRVAVVARLRAEEAGRK